jgi:1-acyl-sn-glycerol-3-phosphate acyltransferase
VVFADSAVGVSPQRSRFRLEAFQAAASVDCPLRPIGIRGTADLFGAHRRTSASWARIRIGEPITPEGGGDGNLVELRERVRAAISKLCG